jgi:hypothetical protein
MAAMGRGLKKYQKRGDIHFAICNSCFWCASFISTNTLDTSYTPTKCPDCHEGNVESIALAQNEIYTFDYNSKRGVVLEFLKWNF